MAEKEKYIINIQGELVEVSPDIYQLYFRMERQERTLVEKVQRHEVSYDAMDNEETVGVEAFADDGPTPEEQAITQEIYDRLTFMAFSICCDSSLGRAIFQRERRKESPPELQIRQVCFWNFLSEFLSNIPGNVPSHVVVCRLPGGEEHGR